MTPETPAQEARGFVALFFWGAVGLLVWSALFAWCGRESTRADAEHGGGRAKPCNWSC
jgi:hypothetical protein